MTVHLASQKLRRSQAATITCAGVTAWDALNLPETQNKGKVAVLQGKKSFLRPYEGCIDSRN